MSSSGPTVSSGEKLLVESLSSCISLSSLVKSGMPFDSRSPGRELAVFFFRSAISPRESWVHREEKTERNRMNIHQKKGVRMHKGTSRRNFLYVVETSATDNVVELVED